VIQRTQEVFGRTLIFDGGWQERPGVRCLNLYRPPRIRFGDSSRATPWVDHLKAIYPEDAEHITDFLAHRIQRPGQKPNHVLGLGGGQGIGKDTLLEPIKVAVGPWNFKEISPANLFDPFNPFVQAVVLRMNEAHDLGESERVNRYALYERLKIYAAAPPDVLRCNDKYLRHYYVPNVLGFIITSNYKSDGMYLPSDDRRHYIAWSHRTKEEFTAGYFNRLWTWFLHEGGNEHVAAYLAQRDLSKFNPNAPPRQTAAFFDIVDAGRSPEDAELADVLDELNRPEICTLPMLAASKTAASLEWLIDRRHRRSIPHRMERCGYVTCRNPNAADGLWFINGRRHTLYGKASSPPEQRIQAARLYATTAGSV
jgi:hypothetical protein